MLNPSNICVRVFPRGNTDTAVSDVISQLAALLITASQDKPLLSHNVKCCHLEIKLEAEGMTKSMTG